MNVAAIVNFLGLYGFPLVKHMVVAIYQTNTLTCIYVYSNVLDTMDMYFLVTTHASVSRKETLRNDFLMRSINGTEENRFSNSLW